MCLVLHTLDIKARDQDKHEVHFTRLLLKNLNQVTIIRIPICTLPSSKTQAPS